MGGCGRWLGLAIDLDAEAVMLNARHKRCTQPNKKTGGKETQGDVASIEHYGFSVKIYGVMGFPFWAAFGGSAIFF
jgi:hypothetical protein